MSDLSVVLVASPIGLPSVGEVFDVEYVHVMSSHGDKNFDEVVVQCTRVPFAYEEDDWRLEVDWRAACIVVGVD